MYKKYAYSYFVITANKFCKNLVNIFLCLCFLKIFVGFLITLLQDKIIKYNVAQSTQKDLFEHRVHTKNCNPSEGLFKDFLSTTFDFQGPPTKSVILFHRLYKNAYSAHSQSILTGF